VSGFSCVWLDATFDPPCSASSRRSRSAAPASLTAGSAAHNATSAAANRCNRSATRRIQDNVIRQRPKEPRCGLARGERGPADDAVVGERREVPRSLIKSFTRSLIKSFIGADTEFDRVTKARSGSAGLACGGRTELPDNRVS
jgi:hypothetical protein